MNATRMSICLAVFSMLSTSAIAGEQSTAAQEEAELQQLQEGELEKDEGDVGTEDVTKQVWPQRTEEFPTYWFVRTDWKVHNPNGQWVQVNVRCNRYGYDAWYWIAPYDTLQPGGWGCEGQPLYIFNNATQYSSLFVQATTW